MYFDGNACRHSCFFPSGQYYTGHILSGKSYKAEGLVILSSLSYDMNGGSVTCTVTGQKHLFRFFSISLRQIFLFMPAMMLAFARNHD